ncbi:MAG: ribonuclease / adenosylcobalamin/alpha-ribazole phosphatase [Cryptosporangiaceae bacterium]|nr:ribonuclease / adenosylcobalamin/alpha-ribazole phosphatase [Cryptosporangiaceae bacterium]
MTAQARRVVVEADGGSRGNPGPAGYGAVVIDAATGELLAERSGHLGVATNNVAEYSGLLAGLEAAITVGARAVDVRMDSKLVVEQMCGRWQVKHPSMKPLAAQAAALVRQLDEVTFTWIPRLQNSRADKLANLAMDGKPVNRDLGSLRDFDSRPEAAAPAPAEAVAAPNGWAPAAAHPTTTVLVRHGASVLSPEKRFSGRGDVPLSPAGSEQARRVAARLGEREKVAAVVSSPLRRAVRTAEAIAAALDRTVIVEPGLAETDFGEWEGLTFAEARAQYPAELDAWLASPDVAPPGGESFAAVARRVRRGRESVLAAHPTSTVVVVSHVTQIKTSVRLTLDAPPTAMFRLHLDTASVSIVEYFADGNSSVHLVNDTSHLG